MEVRNDYTDDDNYTHIDVFFTEDDGEQGITGAIVCRDTKKVYFLDNRLRGNKLVLEAIAEVQKELAQEETPLAPEPEFDRTWVDNCLCQIYAAIGINTPDNHRQIMDFIVADLIDLQIDDPSDSDVASSFRRVLEGAFSDL